MGIAQLARARKCTARYNHVLLFLTREKLNEYITSNKWIRLRETHRKTKGGLAIYYRCAMEKQRGGRCRHKMMAIQRPEGCFVAKTTDGGTPHNHKVRTSQSTQQQNNDPSSEVSQIGIHEGGILANEFETVCSLEEVKLSEQLITTTSIRNEDCDRTYIMQRNTNKIANRRRDEIVTNFHKKTRYSLQSPYIRATEKSFRTSTTDQSNNKLKLPMVEDILATSTSCKDAYVPHHHPITIQRPSSGKRSNRRSLQPNSGHIRHTRRRHSWSGDLFKEAPQDLLRKVKAIRDQQIHCKADDLDKIAVELFTKMDCRRQRISSIVHYIVEMIALDKRLEKLFDTYVKHHCERQKRIGLIGTAAFLIGSKLNDDIFVAHIAVCPLPETADDEAGDVSSRLVDAEWISDHGARVVRFLPGGVSIVGLLWLADKKLAIQARTMLVDALNRINKHSNAISSLGLRPADNKLALISMETPLGRPQGYIVDCSRKGAEGWQTKVTFTQLEWIPVESSASINLSIPIVDPSMMSNFERQFIGAIREWTENLFSTDAVLIDGRMRHRDEPLRSKDKKARGSFHPIKVDTFVSTGGKKQNHKGTIQYSFCVVELSADIMVRAAVLSKATIQNAVDAVKEHIVRTLCSRAELHYESTDVIEDEQKDRISVHQLPRVVCTPLPSQPAIIFNDFLFEGDSKIDAQESFKDYLSLIVSSDCIEDDLERHLEENDLAKIGKSDEGPGRVHRSSSSTSSHNSAATTAVVARAEQLKTNYLVLLSIMVALLAIAIYILLHSLGE